MSPAESLPLEQVRRALADRYDVARPIGAGATATVYLAHDLRHERPVALKVLTPAAALRLGPARFLREIRIAARLAHPHILPVFDSGEAGGLLWYAMPYVERGSLAQYLRTEGRLPIGEAVRLAREVAGALDYAHREGIIHRDVKPENILLREGHAVVADFGIAQPADAAREHLTQSGLALGTPAYMSPEQAGGDETLDGRTDVYGLGTLLFEALTGELPYRGRTARALTARRVSGPVPSCRERRPEIPEALARAVERAMAPAPESRFTTAGAFAEALDGALSPSAEGLTASTGGRWHGPRRNTLVVMAVLAALLAALWVGRGRLAGRGGVPEGIRMAVLPFENLNPPEDDYFADGMTDEVRSKLAALPTLRVIAAASTAEYKRSRKTLQEIGRELGVQYLLTGRIRWDRAGDAGHRVRVYAELVEAKDGTSRWNEPFDAELTDLFRVQSDIADRAAQSLDLALSAGDRRRLEAPQTANLAAYDAYVRANAIYIGQAAVRAGPLREAIGLYEQAVALDSTYAPAWARLAQARVSLFAQTPNVAGTDDPAAHAAAEHALALNPNLAEARLAMGRYYAVVRRDDERALEEYSLGQRADPNHAELLGAIASSELIRGNWETALVHQQLGQAMDPRSARMARRLQFTLSFLRRYAEARVQAQRVLALSPGAPTVVYQLVLTYVGEGDLEGGRAVLRRMLAGADTTALLAHFAWNLDTYWVLDDDQQRRVLRFTPAQFDGDTVNWGLALAGISAERGDARAAAAYADSARAVIQHGLANTPGDGRLHALLGVAYAYLGRKEEAVREGERGVALLPIAKHSYNGAYNVHQLARIYTLVGRPDDAVAQIRTLLAVPYPISRAWLRVDPTWDSLREHPSFASLVLN